MLHHLLKTGELTRRSERNAALTRTLFEAFKDRHKEYTNLRILAANEDTLLFTKSCMLRMLLLYARIQRGPRPSGLHICDGSSLQESQYDLCRRTVNDQQLCARRAAELHSSSIHYAS